MSQTQVTTDEVKKIAKLAKLTLTDEEINNFPNQLTTILSFVSQIQSLDTSNIKETIQVTGLTNITREDKIETNRILTQQEALSNAKQTHKGFFVVDYVFE